MITGEIGAEEIGQLFSGPRDLLRPVLSRLEREGLVEEATGPLDLNLGGAMRAWMVADYGRRLIEFL